VIAAVLETLNAPLTVADVNLTELRYGQVQVRVIASGICGAQLQEIRGEKGGPLPHLLGHEGVGMVEDVGPGVTRVKVGDKCVLHWRKAAGVESDLPRYVYEGREISSGRVTTFQEQAIVSENRVTPVPHTTQDDLCCLLGCSLSTAIATVESETRGYGERVLVIGCGGLGLSILGALPLAAPAHVCAADVHENKRERVERDEFQFVNLTSEKISGDFDLILDTAGAPSAMEAALEHLAPSGRYVMIGQPPPKAPVCIKAARHLFDGEGKTIKATQGGGFRPDMDIPRYLGIAKQLYVHRMITHTFPLSQINQALDVVRAGEAGRVIITMNHD
jgi:S-(hydroxymethyl)glutathione dehydrogenase / alcohol dehydrogenase